MHDLVLYLIGINVLTFLIYGIDKWKARIGKWRIPEDTLIWLAIAGGRGRAKRGGGILSPVPLGAVAMRLGDERKAQRQLRWSTKKARQFAELFVEHRRIELLTF